MGAVGVWKNHIGSFVLSLVDLWILVLGLFMVFLEASKSWCTCACVESKASGDFDNMVLDRSGGFIGKAKSWIFDNYFKALDTVVGRGVFFWFIAALSIATYEKDVGLEGLVGIFTGLAVMVVGVVNVVVGMAANAKFKQLRDKISKEALEAKFIEADTDRSGELDFEELGKFCDELGMNFTHREFELLVQSLDADCSGTVSWDEFKQWWSREFL